MADEEINPYEAPSARVDPAAVGADAAGELEEPSFQSAPATEAIEPDRESAPSEIEW